MGANVQVELDLPNYANVQIESDLSNYATKADSKTATGVNTFDFFKKTGFANLKIYADKLDIDKLKNLASSFVIRKIK